MIIVFKSLGEKIYNQYAEEDFFVHFRFRIAYFKS